MRHKIGFLTVLLSIGLLAACHHGDGNLLDAPNGPSGTLSAQQAAAFTQGTGQTSGSGSARVVLSTATNTNKNVTRNFTDVSGLLAPFINHPNLRSCTPVITGDQTDADGDQIPRNATYTFNCSDSSLFNLKVTGAYTLSDQDDGKPFPLAGLSLSVNNLNIVIGGGSGSGSGSGSVTMNELGNYNLGVSGNTLTSAASFAVTLNTTDNTGKSQNGLFKYFMSATTTADNPAHPEYSGKTDLHGFFVAQYSPIDVTLQVDGSGVTYDHACTTTYFKDGTITFKDGSNNVIALRYAGCALTTTYNGNPI